MVSRKSHAGSKISRLGASQHTIGRITAHVEVVGQMEGLSRDGIVYEAIQREYRCAVVAHIRSCLSAGTGDAAAAVRGCFKPDEWTILTQAAVQARAAGTIANAPSDDVDLLDVTKFANVFEKHFDALFPGAPDELDRHRLARRQTVLSLARIIRGGRDPVAHPVEEEVSVDDARLLVDAARRVVLSFDAEAARRLQNWLNALSSPSDPDIRRPDHHGLESDLPPAELIVRRLVGRQAELEELDRWLRDDEQNRWLLAGAGGRGKSAIAYEFARRVKEEAPNPLTFVLWMSAKKRSLIDGHIATNPSPDIADLPSALDRVLDALGWLTEAPEEATARRRLVLELLEKFPMLIVLDDVDSLEGHDESVLEFFTRVANKTESKVLLTSRRSLGMGSITTMVEGLPDVDALAFVESKIREYRLDPARFSTVQRTRIVEVTKGTPLFIEDLLRLTIAGVQADNAIAVWKDNRGDAAREYALGREVDLLSSQARLTLLAASLPSQAVSLEELRLVTGLSPEALESGVRELQRLFLLASPRLLENVERFELDMNTRTLVLRVVAEKYPDDTQRLRAALTTLLSEVSSAARRGRPGEFVRQARVLSQSGRHEEAEATLKVGLEELPENPVLIGQLGIVYKMWTPKPRVTDARQQFSRARDLASRDPSMYWHWIEMERTLNQWSVAAEIGLDAIKRVPDDQFVRYQTGYALWQQSRQLHRQLEERTVPVLRQAITILRSAVVDPERLTSGSSRLTNSKAYRALTYAFADLVRYLLEERRADDDRTLVGAQRGLSKTLVAWETEHPEDQYPSLARADVRTYLPAPETPGERA
jgi:tetratricopeptide (TPR) repeat protein